MAKINSLVSLSSLSGIDPDLLDELGVVDVLLNADTSLFIDPLLLDNSIHYEINKKAVISYEDKFKKIMKFLNASQQENDPPWKAALKEFNFSEVSYTCLGYSSSINGSGWGVKLIKSTIKVAKQIIDLGVEDKDFFMGLALFEEGIGPDRISDMTTNIILHDLLEFTFRVNQHLKIPSKKFKIKNSKTEIEALINPVTDGPLILVPSDIVRALPIVTDWSEIGGAARHNDELREKLNSKIGGLWTSMTRIEKDIAKASALRSKSAFEEVLELIRYIDKLPYDSKLDKNGEFFWRDIVKSIQKDHPLDLSEFKKDNITEEDFIKLVNTIIYPMDFKMHRDGKGANPREHR
ncbi:hypothetical protein [Photorhabdus bodei]|uniref:Uncharacterized protein n=1 Tax=Photorhabdus bodei TaxID=2029681 RepID=A0A329X4W4_9GAMM|nr:hypothetical protein [Photorhabdus bodei]NDL01017.1 hypothetical protein [Photorhabdus bodei]NDL05247.1 hypothetical protein [Photorhabdus bodei]NDL09526.1 hypothetical protein [Photorhabdus bodei]RAX11475.1 hypothetical protein CKY02_13330 [Photorhabdus bodei]